MHSSYEEHIEAVYKILRYLKRTLGKALLFKKGEHLKVEAYSNSNWTRAINDRMLTLGFCAMFGRNLVM